MQLENLKLALELNEGKLGLEGMRRANTYIFRSCIYAMAKTVGDDIRSNFTGSYEIMHHPRLEKIQFGG